jgi:hypothetical protein
MQIKPEEFAAPAQVAQLVELRRPKQSHSAELPIRGRIDPRTTPRAAQSLVSAPPLTGAANA